jgi:hypothetical protein
MTQKSKSRNADFKICGEAATTTLSPSGLSPPLSASEYNLPPLGGYNPRAKGPSTLTLKVCPRQLITLPLFLTNGII